MTLCQIAWLVIIFQCSSSKNKSGLINTFLIHVSDIWMYVLVLFSKIIPSFYLMQDSSLGH